MHQRFILPLLLVIIVVGRVAARWRVEGWSLLDGARVGSYKAIISYCIEYIIKFCSHRRGKKKRKKACRLMKVGHIIVNVARYQMAADASKFSKDER